MSLSPLDVLGIATAVLAVVLGVWSQWAMTRQAALFEEVRSITHATGHQRNDMFAWRPDTGWPNQTLVQTPGKPDRIEVQREWRGGIVHVDQIESYRRGQRGLSTTPEPEPSCAHEHTEGVVLSTGEVVARICLNETCTEQLPATDPPPPPPGRIITT